MKLFEMTAHEIIKLIKNRDICIYEIVASLFERIEQVDESINSYLILNKEEALSKALMVQKIFDQGANLPDLAGIPYSLKDNICTKNIPTTCASRMLAGFIPPYNATVYEQLLKDNAILLGKVNMDEFAMGSSTENSAFKITKNPWNTTRVPGGSSGGSAAAVAAGEAIFSIGSDTGGSIRQPASFCGVVGFKPTYGSISRYGVVAFASSLDQLGCITKDVEDCALVLNSIVGKDPLDSTSLETNHQDYKKSLVADVKGLKVGIPKEFLKNGINPEVKASVLEAIKNLESVGAICEYFDLPISEYVIPAYYLISSAEASSNLARFDGVKYGYRTENFRNLTELYKNSRSEGFGSEVKRRIMMGTYALSSGYYDAYYKRALQARTLIFNAYQKAFEKYDIIVSPTAPTTAYKIGEKTDNPLEMYLGDIYTASVNIAGLPAISIPCGFDAEKLPIGLQLIGSSFSENTLLRTAYTYEQLSGNCKRRPVI